MLQSQSLAQACCEQEEAENQRALNGPERVGVEVLLNELEVAQVKAEMESRHPDNGQASQRIDTAPPRVRGAMRGAAHVAQGLGLEPSNGSTTARATAVESIFTPPTFAHCRTCGPRG